MDKAKKYILTGAAVACIAVAGWLLYPVIMNRPAANVQTTASRTEEPTIQPVFLPQAAPTSGQTIMIKVSIKGKVMFPGEYYVSPGSTVAEAIEQAGGLLDGADTSKLDMDALVYNNQYIGIP